MFGYLKAAKEMKQHPVFGPLVSPMLTRLLAVAILGAAVVFVWGIIVGVLATWLLT